MTPDKWLASLEKATNEQLKEWQDAISSEMQKRQVKERAEARKKIREIADAHGIDLAKMAPNAPHKKHGVRYRNPNDQFATRSGIGRKPKWVADWLAAGNSLADLEIK